MNLYDRPGAWNVERKHLRKEARRRVALSVGVAALVLVPAASARHINPGGVHQYRPIPHSSGMRV